MMHTPPANTTMPDDDGQVAVVVTCYNHARFLGEAIESALRQTCPAREIIVVNDGSTDDTAAVAKHYPVEYRWQANRGLANARNTGLRCSTSPFIVFLDADDRLLPRALEIGCRYLNAEPNAAFVSGDYVRIGANGAVAHNLGGRAEHVTENHYAALLRKNYIGMHATVMYRRSLLLAVGGFDEALRASEDYDVYLRLARAHPVTCHDAVVAEYRIHGANMSDNAGLMLRNSLSVLRSQAVVIGSDRTLRKAWREGIAYARLLYGRKLLRNVIGSPLGRKQVHDVLTLLQYAPPSSFAAPSTFRVLYRWWHGRRQG